MSLPPVSHAPLGVCRVGVAAHKGEGSSGGSWHVRPWLCQASACVPVQTIVPLSAINLCKRVRERKKRQEREREKTEWPLKAISCPFCTTPWHCKKTKGTYVCPAGRPWWHHSMLAWGVCQAEAGSGGIRLAFGASHFQRWLSGPGIRRILPAKAGWGYRHRAQGAPPPSRLSPHPNLRWGGPLPRSLPHSRTGKSFLFCPCFFKETPNQIRLHVGTPMVHDEGGKTGVTTYPRLPASVSRPGSV